MPQEQIQNKANTIVKAISGEPRKHRVIVLNDDFTTFEFVIMVMMTVFMNEVQPTLKTPLTNLKFTVILLLFAV